jgi:hypothetical protein
MRTQVMTRNDAGMTNDQLRAAAPSIFATQPWEGMSARYTFIPTSDVVEKMRAEGFIPVSAIQSRTRIEGKGDFTKHQIRFRDSRNVMLTRHVGQVYGELVLTNAHDGGSRYVIDAGLLRLACLNGLMVDAGTITPVSMKHTGGTDGIIEASFEVIEQMPKALESIESFQALRLDAPQRQVYATAALELKYDAGEAPIMADQLLNARRYDDRGDSLWQTFNVVQENLVGGGVRGRNVETNRRVKTRPVTGIAENTRLNKALWTLTAEMAKLAK